MSGYNDCTICQKKDTWCETVKSDYAIKGVDRACEKCSSTINKKLQKIRDKLRIQEIKEFKYYLKRIVKESSK